MKAGHARQVKLIFAQAALVYQKLHCDQSDCEMPYNMQDMLDTPVLPVSCNSHVAHRLWEQRTREPMPNHVSAYGACKQISLSFGANVRKGNGLWTWHWQCTDHDPSECRTIIVHTLLVGSDANPLTSRKGRQLPCPASQHCISQYWLHCSYSNVEYCTAHHTSTRESSCHFYC